MQEDQQHPRPMRLVCCESTTVNSFYAHASTCSGKFCQDVGTAQVPDVGCGDKSSANTTFTSNKFQTQRSYECLVGRNPS